MTALTAEDLARRLARVLANSAVASDAGVVFGPGEEALAVAQRQRLERQGIIGAGGGAGLTPAAVLIPLMARDEGVTVLLTQRTPHLAAHAGQISFPGGRLEPTDTDARAAALRETEEEIGLPRTRIEVLGELEEYGTVTGFRVTPVIGIVAPPFILAPDPTEVAEIFEVPLAFILDPANRRHAVERRGAIERDIYEIPFGSYRIWGFTARLLVRLVEVIESAQSQDIAVGDNNALPGAAREKG